MTPSPTHIDPKEMDLIDRVAKYIDPGAWTTCTRDRARARGLAMDIIEEVRNHDAAIRQDTDFEAKHGVNKARVLRVVMNKAAARRAEKEGT